MTQREKLLGLLIDADMKAVESGFAAVPLTRVRAEVIVDSLIEVGVVVNEVQT